MCVQSVLLVLAVYQSLVKSEGEGEGHDMVMGSGTWNGRHIVPVED